MPDPLMMCNLTWPQCTMDGRPLRFEPVNDFLWQLAQLVPGWQGPDEVNVSRILSTEGYIALTGGMGWSVPTRWSSLSVAVATDADLANLRELMQRAHTSFGLEADCPVYLTVMGLVYPLKGNPDESLEDYLPARRGRPSLRR